MTPHEAASRIAGYLVHEKNLEVPVVVRGWIDEEYQTIEVSVTSTSFPDEIAWGGGNGIIESDGPEFVAQAVYERIQEALIQ